MKFRLILLIFTVLLLSVGLVAQNNCLNFDGGDNNIYCYTGFDPAVTQGTIEFWVNLNALPDDNARLISNGANYNIGDELYLTSGIGKIKTVGSLVVGDDIESTNPLAIGVWTHVALTADGSGSTLYINGLIDDTGGAASFAFSHFRFGGQYTAGFYESLNGKMDEIRVWNDVRTQAEIQGNMYHELPNPTAQANLVAYYPLNETTGSAASDGSVNSYIGTLGALTFDTSSVSADWEDGELPVTLSSFTAICLGGNAELQWTTQSESNNLGWNIYRSIDGNVENSRILNYELIAGAGSSNYPTYYSYIDNDELLGNMTYYYWIEDVTYESIPTLHGPVSVTVLGDHQNPDSPEIGMVLSIHNYPNPFNPDTQFFFNLKDGEEAEKIEIYNTRGQNVRTIEYPTSPQLWNGKDYSGVGVSSGIYMYKLTTNRKSYVKKMVLSK